MGQKTLENNDLDYSGNSGHDDIPPLSLKNRSYVPNNKVLVYWTLFVEFWPGIHCTFGNTLS